MASGGGFNPIICDTAYLTTLFGMEPDSEKFSLLRAHDEPTFCLDSQA